MHFDLAAIPQTDAYKLLVSTVVPRPIALATTVDAEGRVNAAPFSFFNAVSSVPPVGIRPPRIAEAPVSFECQRITGLSLGPRSTLEVGRVIHIHIRDDLVDPERYYVATDKMRLIGRMHGRGWYARTSDLFLMDRISFAEWRDGKR